MYVITDANRAIGKAVQLFQPEESILQTAGKNAAALRPDVDCDENGLCHFTNPKICLSHEYILYNSFVALNRCNTESKVMSKVTIENILDQIAQLPQSEKTQLHHLLEKEAKLENPNKLPLDPRLPPKPMPKGAKLAVDWISEHAHEYAGQWVALDGERLIAHSKDHNEVWSAAESDGAEMPLIGYVNKPDEIYVDFSHVEATNICPGTLKLAIIDYDNLLYLSPYDEIT